MSQKLFNVAVVGATGMVGTEMLRTLAERRFPVAKLRALASAKSAGKKVRFGSQDVTVEELNRETLKGIDVALFSAGGSTSREWAPIAAELGALVIDNSSAWRTDPDCPLCVPEVNGHTLKRIPKRIVANPNCSTIQMVVALKPLHDAARIRRIVVSTYQAVSGAGARAVDALVNQERSVVAGSAVDPGVLKGQLARNVLMHWSVDPKSGYQEEELKMVNETRRILEDSEIRVSPTTVRVPVIVGHSEAITLETERPLTPEQARQLISTAPGVRVVDDFAHGVYPQPRDVAEEDDVLVGRIRRDVGNPDGLQMWVVGNNIRKGAALNAVQIAEAVLVHAPGVGDKS